MLAGSGIRNFNRSPQDINMRDTTFEDDLKICRLRDSGEERSFNLEMLHLASLDLKQDRARPLNDRTRHSVADALWNGYFRVRRNQHRLLAAHEKDAAIVACPDIVFRPKNRIDVSRYALR